MKLDRIYTRGGDKGMTSLGDGQRVPKSHARVAVLGGLDEANAALGVALLHIADDGVRRVLGIVQNDLFDLGADICVPEREDAKKTPLRIAANQATALESETDRYNESLAPLTSFVLPGGSAASAHLHFARAVVRRVERDLVLLASAEPVNEQAVVYLNRLSDLLFVLARYLNAHGAGDVLWKPGANR